MYTLTIVRYDITRREMEIFLPIKATSKLDCERLYEENVLSDKDRLIKDYEEIEYIDHNFQYSYRIDKYEDVLSRF
jgi:hypothetical protein